MVFFVKEAPGLDIVFQKDSYGNYTKDSLLNQDILRYAIFVKEEDLEQYFTIRDLTKWLLQNNQEFINYFKEISTRTTRYENRIDNRLPRVRSKLQIFEELRLVKIAGTRKALKSQNEVSLYRSTSEGYFLAWLIESLNSDKRPEADDEIYRYCIDMFKGSLEGDFYLISWKILKEQGRFSDYVDHLRRVVEKGTPIKNVEQIFMKTEVPGHLTDFMHDNPDLMVNQYKEIINKMDPGERESFMYNDKIRFEKALAERLKGIPEYEKMRFRIKGRYDLVAILGICIKCDKTLTRGVQLFEYLKIKWSKNKTFTENCINCKTENSIIFTCP
jgi:hypothetical protein